MRAASCLTQPCLHQLFSSTSSAIHPQATAGNRTLPLSKINVIPVRRQLIAVEARLCLLDATSADWDDY